MYSRAYKTIVAAPPLLWVGLFLLLPYALMFAHSFWLVRDGVIFHQWNLENYAKLFQNPVYAQVLFRTARIAASVTLLSLFLGYPLAYYMSFRAGVRKDLLYQLVIVPLWVSYLVRGYAWKTILGSDGVLNNAHHQQGSRHPDQDSHTDKHGHADENSDRPNADEHGDPDANCDRACAGGDDHYHLDEPRSGRGSRRSRSGGEECVAASRIQRPS